MGFSGPFSSASTSKQTSTTISDQGLLLGKGAKFIAPQAIDYSKAQLAPNYKLGKDATLTINQGVGSDDLNLLLGRVTDASAAQIQSLSGALGSNTDKQLASLAELLGQKTETEAGNPKTLAYIAAASIAAFAFIMWRKFK